MNAIKNLLSDSLNRYGGELRDLEAWLSRRNSRWYFPRTGMFDWLEAQWVYSVIEWEENAPASLRVMR